MIFAMIFAVLVTPDALGSKIEALKKICGEKEVNQELHIQAIHVGADIGGSGEGQHLVCGGDADIGGGGGHAGGPGPGGGASWE